MPALGAGIHVFLIATLKTWMAGTSPAMTQERLTEFAAGTAPAVKSSTPGYGPRKTVTLLPIEYLQKISREAQTPIKACHFARC